MVVAALCLAATATHGDVIVLRDGATIRGRIVSEDSKRLLVSAPGGAMVVSVDREKVLSISPIATAAIATQPARATPPATMPIAISLFREVTTAAERVARTIAAPEATMVQKGIGPDRREPDPVAMVREGLTGKRVRLIARVQEVELRTDGYRLRLTFPAAAFRLSSEERRQVDEHRRVALYYRHQMRDPEITADGRASFKQGIYTRRDRMIEVYQEARQHIPQHTVLLSSRDPAAAAVKKGWMITTDALLNVVRVSRGTYADEPQFLVEAEATADTLGREAAVDLPFGATSDEDACEAEKLNLPEFVDPAPEGVDSVK